jgi:hypothetical protein
MPDARSWPHSNADHRTPNTYGAQNAFFGGNFTSSSLGGVISRGKDSDAGRKWAFLGFVPNAAAKMAALDHDNEILNQPEAYFGDQKSISQLVITRIAKSEMWPIQVLLPWKKWEGGREIHWDVWTFNDHLLGRVPEQSTSRLVTSHRDTKMDMIHRLGLAMMMEHGFQETPAGILSYRAQLQQIANATISTLCLSAQEAILKVNVQLKDMHVSMGQLLYKNRLQQIIDQELDQFAIIRKKPHGMRMLIDGMIKKFQATNGIKPNMCVLGQGTLSLARNRPEFGNYNDLFEGRTKTGQKVALEDLQNAMSYYEFELIRAPGDLPAIVPGEMMSRTGLFTYFGTSRLTGLDPRYWRTHYMDMDLHIPRVNDYQTASYAQVVRMAGAYDQDPDGAVEPGSMFGASYSQAKAGAGGSTRSRYRLTSIGRRFFDGYQTWGQYLRDQKRLVPWIRSFVTKGSEVQEQLLGTAVGKDKEASTPALSRIVPAEGGLLDSFDIQNAAAAVVHEAGDKSGGLSLDAREKSASSIGEHKGDVKQRLVAAGFTGRALNEPTRKVYALLAQNMDAVHIQDAKDVPNGSLTTRTLKLLLASAVAAIYNENARHYKGPVVDPTGYTPSADAPVILHVWGIEGQPDGALALQMISPQQPPVNAFHSHSVDRRQVAMYRFVAGRPDVADALASLRQEERKNPGYMAAPVAFAREQKAYEDAGLWKEIRGLVELAEDESARQLEGIQRRVATAMMMTATSLQATLVQGRLTNLEQKRSGKRVPHLPSQVSAALGDFAHQQQDALRAIYQRRVLGGDFNATEFVRIARAMEEAWNGYREQTKSSEQADMALSLGLNEIYDMTMLGDEDTLTRLRKEFAKPDDQLVTFCLVTMRQLSHWHRVFGEAALEIVQSLQPGVLKNFPEKPGSRIHDTMQERAQDAREREGKVGVGPRNAGLATAQQVEQFLNGLPIQNADIIDFSLENDCYPLVDAILWAPEVTIITSPAVVLRGYGEAGNTFHGHHNFQVFAIANNFTSFFIVLCRLVMIQRTR